MNQFEKMAKSCPPCDICGKPTYAMWGGGWDNDRIICKDSDCGGEIVFATSTEVVEEEK